MIVLYLVIPLALILAAGAVWSFIPATKEGQFDDSTHRRSGCSLTRTSPGPEPEVIFRGL
jgi:cbb3-type cytochrome oxidase maturation protein